MTDLAVDVTVVRGDFRLAAALTAPAGATVVVVGPNGSGKTTLLSAVAGLADVTRGRISVGDVTYDDAATATHLPPQRRRCGVVFQDLRLFPGLSVLDNVAFGARARGVRRPAARARAQQVLADLDLTSIAPRGVSTLSGGEAQRVALARAVAIDPSVLLLDEALSALDVRTRAKTRTVLRSVIERLDVPRVVVTHDPVEALSLADELVVLEGGTVTWTGRPDELPDAPPSAFLGSLIGLNVVRGAVRSADSDVWVAGPGVDVFVTTDVAAGTSVLAVFEPSAVTLSTSPPAGSARNVLRATVVDVVQEGPRAQVRLDGPIPLHADVTAVSVESLHLRPGAEVWASVKATEVRVEPL